MPQDFQTRLLDPVSKPYSPTDYASVRQRILDNTAKALGQRFPLENDRFKLEAVDLGYDDVTPTLKDEKNAILQNGSVTAKLRGKWRLTNKETGEVQTSKPRIMMNVPWMTERGTFIRNGSEKTINYMFRLTPGVYSRKKDNGMFEAHVNPKQGTGGQFKIELDPKTGIFRVKQGTRGYKLYTLLKRAGVTDDQIKKSWGAQMLDINRRATDIQQPTQTYSGGIPKVAADKTADYDALLEKLMRTELDPISTEITLGKPHPRLTPETLLEGATKVLRLSRGEAEEDFRDGLEFQKIDGPADYFAERIIRDGGGLARGLLWRASRKGSLDDIPPAPLNKHVDSIFNESRHAGYIDGSSLFSAIDLSTRISRIGEGGISGSRTAPSETRAVQDSFAGYIDPVRSVESVRVGLDMYLGSGVRKGDDGKLYTQMLNAKTGKKEWVDSLTAARSKIATRAEHDSEGKFIPAMHGSRGIKIVPKKDVDYYIMDTSSMFSLGANTVPAKSGIMANRLHMGGKYGTQAMPLVHREAPLVRGTQGDGVAEEQLGDLMGVRKADFSGRVMKVTKDSITVGSPTGETKTYELYDNFPFNQKGYLRSIPKVKVGDEVKKGNVLATTNFTDDKGAAAQGRNLRVAYINWKGHTFEDAIAISESAAKKLAAEKMYKSRLPVSKNTEFSKKEFMGKFASKYTKAQMDAIGEDGLVKPGTVLQKGDPMIVAVRHNEAKPGSLGRRTRTDVSETWNHDYEGVVVESMKGDKHATVYTRANVPMKTGDKMSSRYAAKGVVNVLPDNEMPLDADGNPIDVLLSPLGIISRVNPSQVVEAMAGKVARKTGKPEVLEGFEGDMIEKYDRKLRENGLTPTETLYDPRTGRAIPEVLTGEAFYYRLMHMSEDKGSGRGVGGATGEETPSRGGKGGAPFIGGLHTSALVSHNAMKVLKDAKLIRGQANDDFWRDFRMGKMPKMPGTPLVNEKFYAHLKGAGINVDENADRINFFGMTNEQARKLARGHELKVARTYNQKNMQPIDGGLFDPKLFGANGNDWAYIQLDEPLPNPVMEPAIASVLGMTQKKFNAVMAGEEELNGKKGGEAVADALAKLDMSSEVKSALIDLKSASPSKKDKALKRYRFLKSMEEQGVHPKEFMMDRVPVLPPKFRPVTQLDGTNITADANIMYRSLMFARDDLRQAKERLPGKMLDRARKKIYSNYKALTGMYNPDDTKLEEKNVQGLLKWVFGKKGSKYGAYNRRVLGTAQNIAGRGVVVPNPAMPLNKMGIPMKDAWKVFEPFVVRNMVRAGHTPLAAMRLVADRDKKAESFLRDAVKERPILVNRAPTLHKYGVMAFEPVLVKGSAVQVSPSIVSPYNMDFDGDTVTYYAPVSKEAVEEARAKMLPEKNLISPRDMTAHYKPMNEFVQGLYLATRAPKGQPKKTFRTVAEAQDAYNKGEIDIDTPIIILETEQS